MNESSISKVAISEKSLERVWNIGFILYPFITKLEKKKNFARCSLT